MVNEEYKIKNDNNSYFKKALYLNFFLIQGEKSRFTNQDVVNLKIKNVNNINELVNLFKTTIIANFLVCGINQKGNIVKKNNKTTLEVLIRFISIPTVEEKLDDNNYLCIYGDINLEDGVVNVKKLFLTAMLPLKNDFELEALNIAVKSVKTISQDTKENTIFNSQTMQHMKYLVSSFKEEKVKWENFLNFQKDHLNYKRNLASPYLDYHINQYIKIARWNNKYDSLKEHTNYLFSNNYNYFLKNDFLQHFTIQSNNKQLESVNVISLKLLVNDNNANFIELKKLNDLSLSPLAINKNFIANDYNDLVKFDFNERIDRETLELIQLSFFIPHVKSAFTYDQLDIALLLGFINDEQLSDENQKKQAIDKVEKLFNQYHLVDVFYEMNEETFSLETIEKNLNSNNKQGYLVYLALGESTLINRNEMILDKIERNDVANPYLTNYIFNINNVKVEQSKINIDQKNIKWASNLNDIQKKVIVKALNCQDIFLLQGPPGTGKTQIINELICQYVSLGKKVLLSSQNHIAIDNVLQRLPKIPSLVPLRLTSKETRIKNKFTDYNPDRLVFNYYNATYNFLSTKYLNKWKSIETNLDQQISLLQKLKADTQFQNKMLADLEVLKKEHLQLEKERNNLVKQKTSLNHNINQLKMEINNLNNFLDFLNDSHINININFNNELLNLFTNSLGELTKTILNIEQIDDSLDIKKIYQNLKQHLIQENLEELEYKKQRLESKKQEYQQLSTNELFEQITDLAGQIKMIEAKLAYKTDWNQFKQANDDLISKINQFINDKSILITKEEQQYNQIDSIVVEQKINLLKDDISSINKKVKPVYIETLNLINQLNNNYNLSLQQESLISNVNKINDTLSKINKDLKKIKTDQKIKSLFVKSTIDFLQSEYQLDKDQFSSFENTTKQMDQESKRYGKKILDNNVNVVAMTASANQRYKENNNDALKQFAIGDVDIKKFNFDVVIIDEVSKLTPMEIFMPLVYGKAVVLVGDYRQLPPVFKYQRSEVEKINKQMNKAYLFDEFHQLLTESMFKQLITKADSSIKDILTMQYRFNSDIMRIVNVFYDNQLQLGDVAQDESKQHLLSVVYNDLPIFTDKSIYWFDSSFDSNEQSVYEAGESNSTSLFNPLEIDITVRLFELIEQGYTELETKIQPKPTVAIISFYALHVKKLKNALENSKFKYINVIVSTVDDFQGKESDIIIVNIVRNPKNKSSSVKEFVQRYERLNVAFSRAKKLLAIVGSINFLKNIEVTIPTVNNPNESIKINAYEQIMQVIDFHGKIFSSKQILDQTNK